MISLFLLGIVFVLFMFQGGVVVPDSPLAFVVDSAAVAFVVKILVDVTKGFLPDQMSKFLPLVAIVYGILIQVLAVVANSGAFTKSIMAQQIFAGIISGFGAWAVTGIHNLVRPESQ